MKYCFFILLIIGGVYSCTDIKKGEQIESIEGMINTLDSLENLILTTDLESLEKIENSAGSIEMRIKYNISNDTIDFDLVKKIDEFKRMHNNLNPLKKNYDEIKSSISDEKISLANLRADIENGNGERAKYNEFILFEEKKMKRIQMFLSKYLEQKEVVLSTINELHNELNDYSFSLEDKNNRVQ